MQDSKHGIDRRLVISAAWILVTSNYLFANIFKLLGGFTAQTADEVELVNSMATPEMLLFAAIYLEMAMVMIIFSLLLKQAINRCANIVIASLHALGSLASLSVVAPTFLPASLCSSKYSLCCLSFGTPGVGRINRNEFKQRT
ncbi:MAG TPA: DUF6326 family protein [Wenzhouxiangellaceae bacterium]|nr:DUF6326 family protein [Wenzhouxiangellaceae bacterium]